MNQIGVLFNMLAVVDAVGDPEQPMTWIRVVGKVVVFLIVLVATGYAGDKFLSFLFSFIGDPEESYIDEYGNNISTFGGFIASCFSTFVMIAMFTAAIFAAMAV
jgi:hypothetical protein